MDLISSILSALLFAAFVPGVLVTIPSKGSKATILVVHAVLFAVVVSLVMQYYWTNIRGVVEAMGNYGITCPNGYVMTGDQRCEPVGHATSDATTGFKSS
jgi:hypothetical protein